VQRIRAQLSVEFLVVAGLVLLILTPLWVSLLRAIQAEQADLRISQAHTALERIVQGADLVYVQGSPASVTVTVYVPPGVLNYSLSNNETMYRLSMGTAFTDVVEPTKTPFAGSLPITEGTYKLLVSAEDTGVVNITSVS
jgi:hypothetical protein